MAILLPTELIEQIVLYSNSFKVAYALKDYITKHVYDECDKNILVYGNVQSGKTKEIINILKEPDYQEELKVLVVQNSLLVLKQYRERLLKENIDYQVITKNTRQINKKVIVVIGNIKRYAYFKNLITDSQIKKYILIMDEADQIAKNCSLLSSGKNYKTFYITATPYKNINYNRIILAKSDNNYYGIDKLNIHVDDDLNNIIDEFLSTHNGMMLINKYLYIEQMEECAINLSTKYKTVPIVLLTSKKFVYIGKNVKKLKNTSISKIIDNLKDYKHIIFIANRLSNRGLSYVSSDFTRHLTYQITKVKSSVTNFLQSLRILGVYKDYPELKLFINSEDEVLINKHFDYIYNFEPKENLIK